MASPKPDQSAVKTVIEPTNPTRYRQAIVLGKAALASENSKAAAARVIFQELVDEPREVVLRAFIEGASVTPKGSPTYFYNISRKFKRLKNPKHLLLEGRTLKCPVPRRSTMDSAHAS